MATYKTYNGLVINTEDVTKKDMPNELFSEIYELCGADTALSLLSYMAGNIIQVPTKGFSVIEKRIIVNEFDGSAASLRKISRKFNMPELGVRRILRDAQIEAPVEGQCSFSFMEN